MQKVIERILNLLAFLLTVKRPVTADEIRQTVAGYDQESDEAFRRMFERDKDLLRRLGVPLKMGATDVWEVEYGYTVSPEEYGLTDPGLTDEERAALWLAAQIVRLGGQATGAGVILKLGGAPAAAAGEPLVADLGTSADDLAAIFSAVVERRRVRFSYRDKTRRVEPLGLVHRKGHWYLVGREGQAGEVKAFRIDRTRGLELVGSPYAFVRPVGFRASAAVAEAPWEAGESDISAVTRFDPEVAWWARRQLTGVERIEEEVGGSITVRMTVANPDAFVGWVLAFEDHAEVLEPAELRRRVIERVRGES